MTLKVIGDAKRLEITTGADQEHRSVVLRFVRAEEPPLKIAVMIRPFSSV